MKLIYKYILNHFSSTFLSLFCVLFLVVSIIFFIQLARLTASIEISFLDFLKLYSFMLPRILIFTLPVSFFISLSLMLYRLSRENESLVCFALGFSPLNLAFFFLKIALAFCIFLLTIALIFIPLAEELKDNFISYKQSQVKFNLKTGELGQKLFNFFLFVEKEDAQGFSGVIAYESAKDGKQRLFIAKRANYERDERNFNFILKDVLAYNLEANKTLFTSHFDELRLNSYLTGFESEKKGVLAYWSLMKSDVKRAKEFVIYTAMSLFPLASALFALSFGIVTYRYEKGFIYLGIFLVIAFYFSALSVFYEKPFLSVFLIFILSFLASLFYFKQKILSRY